MRHLLSFVTSLAVLGLCLPGGVRSASAEAPQEKEWTFMVYMNGDNDLDPHTSKDIKEMKKVGTSPQVNIVVLLDQSDPETSTKLLKIEKNKAKVVFDYKENIDMGDWQQLVSFFRLAKERFPARHYFIDIWSHGSGWAKGSNPSPIRGISHDENSGNHISTIQLGEAFRQILHLNNGKAIDLFGMDACQMQMVEVIYQLGSTVRYVGASENNIPSKGWYYTGFLSRLVAKPEMSAEELGVLSQSEYVRSFQNGEQGDEVVQGSLVSVEKVQLAQKAIANWVEYSIHVAPELRQELVNAWNQTQTFSHPYYRDLIHFIRLSQEKVQEKFNDARFRELSETVLVSLRDSVVANFVNGERLKDSQGISSWIPDPEEYELRKKYYLDLNWTRDARWAQWIESLWQ